MTRTLFRQSLIAGAVVFLWGCSAEEQAAAPADSDPVQFVAPATGLVI